MAKAKAEKDACCHDHAHCCGGKILWGLILLVVGLAIKYNFDFADILILVGALLLVKGIVIKSMMRD